LRVLLNAVAAKMGGAANYIRNIALELESLAPEHEFICVVPEEQVDTVRGLARNLQVIAAPVSNDSYLRRLWFDQVTLRRMLRSERIDVLYSTANFGMLFCPCRQVLLVRNMLYFSPAYEQLLFTAGLKARCENAMRRWLVCRSVKSADTVLTPSRAMLEALLKYCPAARGKTVVNPYGVRPPGAHRATTKPFHERGSAVTLLFTSLYAEHKNLGTLLRALKELSNSGVEYRLMTPADPDWQGPRRTATWQYDSQMARDPDLSCHLEFTGVLDGEAIARLYALADVFVYPSTIESFGHPLLEAMAAGLPVVAADAPINRELCADSAVYFRSHDATDCARQIRCVIDDPYLADKLIRRGVERSRSFQWREHTVHLIELLANSHSVLAPESAGSDNVIHER
jgi:glycosyltransferase involved in cell wall biosynthesis